MPKESTKSVLINMLGYHSPTQKHKPKGYAQYVYHLLTFFTFSYVWDSTLTTQTFWDYIWWGSVLKTKKTKGTKTN